MAAETLILTSTVKTDLAGKSLVDYLCARFPYKDKAGWLAEIAAGHLSVNDKAPRAGQRLQLKDRVSYTAERDEPAVATDIGTLYEDEHLWVVNKPAPLPVHADGVFITNTLIHMLRQRSKNKDLSLGHRLDRETSGVLVLAKDRHVTARLMACFEDSGVEKWYLAVARGEAKFQEQLVRGQMGPKPGSQISLRQHLVEQRQEGYKDSATRFLLKEPLKGFSLLACQLLTGRTNQIRVHLEAIGLPLAGDKLYGRTDEEYLAYVRHLKAGGSMEGGGPWEHPRQLLHAWKLGLRHPMTGERMQWEAPVPEDMKGFLGRVKA